MRLEKLVEIEKMNIPNRTLVVNPYLFLPGNYPIAPVDIVVSRSMCKFYRNTDRFTDEAVRQPARLVFQMARKYESWKPISWAEATKARTKRQLGASRKRQHIDTNPRLEHLTSRNLMVEINGEYWFTHLFIVSAMMASVPKIEWAIHESINSDKKLYPIRPSHIDTEKSFGSEGLPVLSQNLMIDARVAVKVCQEKGYWGQIHLKDLVMENENLIGRCDFFTTTLTEAGMLKSVGPNSFLPTRKLALWSFLGNPKGNWFSTKEEILARSCPLTG